MVGLFGIRGRCHGVDRLRPDKFAASAGTRAHRVRGGGGVGVASADMTPATDPYVNVNKLPAFYQKAIRTFPHPLPDGVAWPAKVPAGFDDPNVHYEPEGRGEALASTYWLCAWQGEYLGAFESHEQQRRAEALTMLDAFVVDPYFTKVFLDPDQGWKRDVLDPARNGDTWRMKSQHSSCPAAE